MSRPRLEASLPRRAPDLSRCNQVYAITLHQPWASLIALGIKTVETRSWPAPERLVGQTIAVHAGKRVVRQPGDRIEQELRARLGEGWRRTIPAGAVLATATLAGMARVAYVNLMTGSAVHDVGTEMGCAVGVARTNIDPGGVTSGPAAGCGSLPTWWRRRHRYRPLAISHSGTGSRTATSLDGNCSELMRSAGFLAVLRAVAK